MKIGWWWWWFLPLLGSALTCISLPSTALCSSYVTYRIDSSICVSTSEMTIDTRTWSALSPACRHAVAQYECTKAFPPCSLMAYPYPLPPQQVCTKMQQVCNETIRIIPSSFAIAPLPTNSPLYASRAFLPAQTMVSDLAILNEWTWNTTGGMATKTCQASNPSAYLLSSWKMPAAPIYQRCELYRGTECLDFIPAGSSIWLTATGSQDVLEAAIHKSIRKMLSWQDRSTYCQAQMGQVLCARLFPRCDASSATAQLIQQKKVASSWLAFPYPHPNFVSKAFCQDTLQRCNVTLFQALKLFQCDSAVTLKTCSGVVLGSIPEWAQQLLPLPAPAPLDVYGTDRSLDTLARKALVLYDDTSYTLYPGAFGVAAYALPSNNLANQTQNIQQQLSIPCDWPHVESEVSGTSMGRLFPGQCLTGCVLHLLYKDGWNELFVASIVVAIVVWLCMSVYLLVPVFNWMMSGFANRRRCCCRRKKKSGTETRLQRKIQTHSLLYGHTLGSWLHCTTFLITYALASSLRTFTSRTPISSMPLIAPLICAANLRDNVKQGDPGSEYCTAQAFMLTYVTMVRSWYFFFFAWDTVLVVTASKLRSSTPLWLQMVYHGIAQWWGWFFAFYMLGEKAYHARPDLLLCGAPVDASVLGELYVRMNQALTYSSLFAIVLLLVILVRRERQWFVSKASQSSKPPPHTSGGTGTSKVLSVPMTPMNKMGRPSSAWNQEISTSPSSASSSQKKQEAWESEDEEEGEDDESKEDEESKGDELTSYLNHPTRKNGPQERSCWARARDRWNVRYARTWKTYRWTVLFLLTTLACAIFYDVWSTQSSSLTAEETLNNNLDWLSCFLYRPLRDCVEYRLPYTRVSYRFGSLLFIWSGVLPFLFFGLRKLLVCETFDVK